MQRPDIVLLVLDTQRVDRLACCGFPVETSPYLDAFAAEATIFSHAISPAQWTVPSHASMFTGLYPSQHTVFQVNSLLPENLATLAERLQQGGYFTAGFSNNPLIGSLNNGLQRGFDSLLNYGGLLSKQPGWANMHSDLASKRRQGFNHRLSKLSSRIQNTLANSNAANKLRVSPVILPLWRMGLKLKGNLKGDTPQTLSDASQLLIERYGTEPGQPVFIFINLMGVHAPYNPPHWAVKQFAPRLNNRAGRVFLRRLNAIRANNIDFISLVKTDAPCASPGQVVERPLLSASNHAARAFLRRVGVIRDGSIDKWLGQDGLDDKYNAMLQDLYNAEVAAQDVQIGLFLHRLWKTGALDRTLFIIVSDHGEHLGEKQMIGHNFGVHEELIHVPLLIRDPSGCLPRGATMSPFVSTRRVFHTALTAAGVATSPEEALSLTYANSNDPDQDVVFAEAEPLQTVMRLMEKRRPGLTQELGYDLPYRAVYHDEYKLIAHNQDQVKLYNVRDDPTENVDLGQVLPEKVKALRKHLHRLAQHTPGASISQLENDPLLRQRLKALGYLE